MRIDGKEFLAAALRHVGCPYIWGSRGPESFDCSGLITYALWECGGPDWRKSHNAERLFRELEPMLLEVRDIGEMRIPVDAPAGSLAFYGPPGGVNHVMLAVGDGRVFGACGGGSGTTTPQRGACVQYRPSARYRPDLLSWRRLPEALRHG